MANPDYSDVSPKDWGGKGRKGSKDKKAVNPSKKGKVKKHAHERKGMTTIENMHPRGPHHVTAASYN